MTKPTWGIGNTVTRDPTEKVGTRPNFIAAKPAATKPSLYEKAAVWVKFANNGTEYLSIKINDVNGETLNLTVFKNKTKKSTNAPDYVRMEKLQYDD